VLDEWPPRLNREVRSYKTRLIVRLLHLLTSLSGGHHAVKVLWAAK
jgi:hypothetical protein